MFELGSADVSLRGGRGFLDRLQGITARGEGGLDREKVVRRRYPERRSSWHEGRGSRITAKSPGLPAKAPALRQRALELAVKLWVEWRSSRITGREPWS